MKRVWSGSTLVDVTHLHNLLELAGIRSTIKNRMLSAALGELPFLDCGPELWVVDDRDERRAGEVIREALQPVPGGAASSAWRCGSCGEANESQFAACWNCGAGDASE
jgi:hypothetical protein